VKEEPCDLVILGGRCSRGTNSQPGEIAHRRGNVLVCWRVPWLCWHTHSISLYNRSRRTRQVDVVLVQSASILQVSASQYRHALKVSITVASQPAERTGAPSGPYDRLRTIARRLVVHLPDDRMRSDRAAWPMAERQSDETYTVPEVQDDHLV